VSLDELLDAVSGPPRKPPEPARLVVAAGRYGDTVVLWADGEDARRELSEVSHTVEDHDIDLPGENGIWVWEGVVKYKSWRSWEGDYDCEVSWVGAYRVPTEDEWRAIRLGVSPWPDPPDENPDDDGCAGCLSACDEHPCLSHGCKRWCRVHYMGRTP
jgi:hypothetical protein